MGELLLVCAIVTLILLVLFINKKKHEERQFYAQLHMNKEKENTSARKRYSRDDSVLNNRRSPNRPDRIDSSFNYEHRYRQMYSPGNFEYKNYEYMNMSNYRSFLTPTGFYDTYEKGKNYKYDNNLRSEEKDRNKDIDKDLKTEKFNMNNTSNTKNFYMNDQSKVNAGRQSFGKSQSLPPYISLSQNGNNIPQYQNQNVNPNTNNIPVPNQNEQGPGYKVIKLEDYISRDSINSKSPMFKNQPKITLDDINPSLIKYLKKEADHNISKPQNIGNLFPINSKKNDYTNPLYSKEANQEESSFYQDLIPKKIDFSQMDQIDKSASKKEKEEGDRLSFNNEHFFSFTPANKEGQDKFESFGEEKLKSA